MNRKMIYSETKNYTKKNWKIMVAYTLVTVLAIFLLSGVLGIPSLVDAIKQGVQAGLDGNTTIAVDSYVVMGPLDYLIQIVINSLTSFLNAGLIFGVMVTYRNKRRLSLRIIFEEITKKPFTIFLASLILSLVGFILGAIPVVGFILSFIFTLASYFALIVLQENDVEPIDAVLLSFKLTRGHKFNLFLVEFKYFRTILGALFLWLILTMFGMIGFGIGLLLFLGVTLRVGPNLVAAAVIYYDKIVNGIYESSVD